MSRITNSILTLTLTAAMFTTTASAQTKVSFSPQKGADKASLANPQKAGAKTKQSVEDAAKDFKSPWALYDASDKLAYGSYVANTGNKPSFNTISPKGVKKVSKADEQKKWTYTGFNAYAGKAEDGTTATGGLVDFNIQPFECDTVSSDNGLSPYSYMAKGKLYCFLPSTDYTKITRSIYDANTLVRLSQKTFTAPGTKDRVPYLMSYDDQRDVVYAISMGGATTNGDEDSYYLNVLDTATCSLKRIGYLGGYSSTRDKGNFSPKAFTATGGVLRTQISGDSIYIYEINPLTCEKNMVGRTEIPTEYTYGLQPMLYDSNTGNLTIMHYDFTNGTQLYKVAPFLAYGAKDNVLKTELIEKLPTGFTFYYKRPETETSYFKYQLADISDLKATANAGETKATVSFTIPSTDENGNAIDIPSYSSDGMRCYIYADNNYVTPQGLPSSMKMGDKVSCTVDLTGGMHVITVLLYPYYNDVASVRTSTILVCGYDAPETVGSPTLAVKDSKATITWTAPKKGKYSDFGSTFDASDITYKVVRNNDGKVIADGITATTAEDSELGDEIQTYSYTIYATSHGETGIGALTNSVTAGKYLPLPYSNDFSAADCLNGYTILNLDNNGSYRTWNWNNYYKTLVSGWGTADDWFITPTFSLTSDKLYAFGYKLNGNGHLRTTVGTGNTPEAQNEVLNDLNGYTTSDYETQEFYFRPAENGLYNFGLYNYNLDGESWNVDDLTVKEIATETAPDKVRSLNVTPDAKGALGATLSFKLPATAINGNTLSSLTKVTVYDLDGNVLGSQTNVAPGADCSIKVTAVHGWNDFKIVAANADGEGWPVIIRKFIGADKPKAVSDLKVTWGEARNVANLSWTVPTEGVNGGYVDPSAYTYTIYKYDSKADPQYTKLGTSDETSIEVEIKDASTTQDQYVFGITASNDEGESSYARAGIVLGVPYTLPFTEPFDANKGITHSPWIADQGWTLDQGFYNDKVQPQNNDKLQLVFINAGTGSASGKFYTPIIDFTNTTNPVLSVWLHHTEGLPEGTTVKAVASLDGSKNCIEIGDAVKLDGNNGWTEHVFDLSALKGKKAQVALEAYLPTPSGRVFADNWTIKEAAGNDLALTAISQPYYPTVGDKATIDVTVANKGAQVANNYSVLFYLNGEAIDEKESTEALGIGKQATFSFPLNITAAQKEYVYSAEVMYDGDENEDNNSSTEVEINPTQIALPAPTNLTLNGNEDLSWMAPETMDGREVTLDFEDVPTFTTDNIKGWKTIDRDGHLTLTFVQYYNNYWPYANQPLAWMTWSAKEAGCPDAEMWKPYEGEKCLIHFGNYGADAEGRTNNEADDDWFISPEVKGGTEFSFMTSANEATNSIEILTSSTDQEPESFTNKVKTVTYDATATWQEVKVTLPADAKYVAIHTVLDGFGTMIDNIKYTEAKAPKLLGYNVYNGTELNGETTTATAAKAQGNGSYAVSAVYDLGESELSNSVAVTSGIDEITSGQAKVIGGNGTISIINANGSEVNIFSASGQAISKVANAGNETVSVPAGIYIAKVGNKTYKITVK